MSNYNRELSQFARFVTVDDASQTVSFASTGAFTVNGPIESLRDRQTGNEGGQVILRAKEGTPSRWSIDNYADGIYDNIFRIFREDDSSGVPAVRAGETVVAISTEGNVCIGSSFASREKLQVNGNLAVGFSTESNYITFHGVFSDGSGASPGQGQKDYFPVVNAVTGLDLYTHTFIGERLIGDGSIKDHSELLIFKGDNGLPAVNGVPGTGPLGLPIDDRIRYLSGEHRFQIMKGKALYGSFEAVGSSSSVRDALVITGNQNTGVCTVTAFADLRVGFNTTANYIAFHGTTGDGINRLGAGIAQTSNPLRAPWTHTYIGERIFSAPGPFSERSELLLYKGNDGDHPSGKDRIRHISGEHVFQLAHDASLVGTFQQVGASSSVTDALSISGIGTVGIVTVTVYGNLRVGYNTQTNYIAFHGTSGDGSSALAPGIGQTINPPRDVWTHTYIGERIYRGPENSELLIYKGNDNTLNGIGTDRIRHLSGEHLFQITTSDVTAGTFEQVGTSSTVTNAMMISGIGSVGVTTTTIYNNLVYLSRPAAASVTAIGVDASGKVRESTSSIRFKKNVASYEKGLLELADLNPVTFNYNEDPENATPIGGLIAEEVAAAGFEEFVLREEDGQPKSVHYGNMVALLINAVKELKAENDDLRARVEALEAE